MCNCALHSYQRTTRGAQRLTIKAQKFGQPVPTTLQPFLPTQCAFGGAKWWCSLDQWNQCLDSEQLPLHTVRIFLDPSFVPCFAQAAASMYTLGLGVKDLCHFRWICISYPPKNSGLRYVKKSKTHTHETEVKTQAADDF